MPTLDLTPEIKDYAVNCLQHKLTDVIIDINCLYSHAIEAIARNTWHNQRIKLMEQITKIPHIVDALVENEPLIDTEMTTIVLLATFLLTNRVSKPFAMLFLPEDYESAYTNACMALKDNTPLTASLTTRELENNLRRARPWNHGNERPEHMLPIYAPHCMATLFWHLPEIAPHQYPENIFRRDTTNEDFRNVTDALDNKNYDALTENGGNPHA